MIFPLASSILHACLKRSTLFRWLVVCCFHVSCIRVSCCCIVYSSLLYQSLWLSLLPSLSFSLRVPFPSPLPSLAVTCCLAFAFIIVCCSIQTIFEGIAGRESEFLAAMPEPEEIAYSDDDDDPSLRPLVDLFHPAPPQVSLLSSLHAINPTNPPGACLQLTYPT